MKVAILGRRPLLHFDSGDASPLPMVCRRGKMSRDARGYLKFECTVFEIVWMLNFSAEVALDFYGENGGNLMCYHER